MIEVYNSSLQNYLAYIHNPNYSMLSLAWNSATISKSSTTKKKKKHKKVYVQKSVIYTYIKQNETKQQNKAVQFLPGFPKQLSYHYIFSKHRTQQWNINAEQEPVAHHKQFWTVWGQM